MGLEILLYVPNIIGYVRLLLLCVSWWIFNSQPIISIVFYGMSAMMDALDGYAARKLNQISAFGAWFDIVIDILGRGMLWCRLWDLGYLVICVEWLCFICTHSLGSNWKSSFINMPNYVKAVMANNFKTPAGVFAIGGLHGLPVLVYCYMMGCLNTLQVPLAVQWGGFLLLVPGRVLCAAVELWCIWSHILYLTSDEANPRPGAANASPANSNST